MSPHVSPSQSRPSLAPLALAIGLVLGAPALAGEVPIIGVGGIMQGADAVAKLDAGASLVQLYSGFIYRGPDLVGDVARAIAERRR